MVGYCLWPLSGVFSCGCSSALGWPPTSERSGTTNYAPGTTLTVTVNSSEGLLFLRRHDVTVHPNRTFTAPFNFSLAPIGEEFRVLVESTNANITGTVRPSSSPNTTRRPNRLDSVSHGVVTLEPPRQERGPWPTYSWLSAVRWPNVEAVTQSPPFTYDDV